MSSIKQDSDQLRKDRQNLRVDTKKREKIHKEDREREFAQKDYEKNNMKN